jgi:myo-inositol-1(or 4)-monophosphatase
MSELIPANPFLGVAIEIAREAGAILREEYAKPPVIRYKGEVDIVTQADKRSEALIVERLRGEFSSHTIVAEEGGGSGDSTAEYVWHVDPLDGTTNFAHGYPCFAVSLALLKDGEPIIGVVFDPIHDELFSAARGQGARLNGAPIHVSAVAWLAQGLLATGFPVQKRTLNSNIYYYWDFTLRSHGVRRDGAAALDLCYVACGRFDGFWEFGLKSWDTAAGMLLVTEAGGSVSDFAGRPFHPGGAEILATNGHIHEEMRQIAVEIGKRAALTPLQAPPAGDVLP